MSEERVTGEVKALAEELLQMTSDRIENVITKEMLNLTSDDIPEDVKEFANNSVNLKVEPVQGS